MADWLAEADSEFFRRAIALKNADGEVNPGYGISLDAKDLKPGANRITFEVELSPDGGDSQRDGLQHQVSTCGR